MENNLAKKSTALRPLAKKLNLGRSTEVFRGPCTCFLRSRPAGKVFCIIQLCKYFVNLTFGFLGTALTFLRAQLQTKYSADQIISFVCIFYDIQNTSGQFSSIYKMF